MSILFAMGVAWLIIRAIAGIWASYNGNKAPKQWHSYEQSKQHTEAMNKKKDLN